VGYNALQWCFTLWVTICVTVVRYAVGDDVRYGALQCVTAVRYAVGDDLRYGALQCEFIISCVPATVRTRPSTVVLTGETVRRVAPTDRQCPRC